MIDSRYDPFGTAHVLKPKPTYREIARNMKDGDVGSRRRSSLPELHVGKASDILADAIRERILEGDYRDGEVLPTEREMCVQTKLGRRAVRDALLSLELQGLIRTDDDRAGGPVVQRPTLHTIIDNVEITVRGSRIPWHSILETREVIEPFCARLAAVNRTDEDLSELDKINSVLENSSSDLDAFLRSNFDWHVSVSRAGGNQLCIAIMTALSRIIYTSSRHDGRVNEVVMSATVNRHRAVTDAIRQRDAVLAAECMTDHIHEFALDDAYYPIC
ncbi:FadR/GntR family transcriptional regulator [Rhodococcus sp. LB1]|uniref:FadR/GntR family transcriptional regulator n=1 Tax=Rhodococcus sp. LB1 TaxID=1807499 RepID=UPI0009EE1D4C|nr:FCD domain-containing protein [Rhodococcus sp. LB1]